MPRNLKPDTLSSLSPLMKTGVYLSACDLPVLMMSSVFFAVSGARLVSELHLTRFCTSAL